MLSDYIKAYKEAMKEGNKKEMEKIERELASLGMDKYTLMAIVKDV